MRPTNQSPSSPTCVRHCSDRRAPPILDTAPGFCPHVHHPYILILKLLELAKASRLSSSHSSPCSSFFPRRCEATAALASTATLTVIDHASHRCCRHPRAPELHHKPCRHPPPLLSDLAGRSYGIIYINSKLVQTFLNSVEIQMNLEFDQIHYVS
jgi:hypothetical protein